MRISSTDFLSSLAEEIAVAESLTSLWRILLVLDPFETEVLA